MIVYFDFETGGVDAYHPDIQLAAAAVDGQGAIVETFQRKIQFDVSTADPEALKINHYDPAVWAAEAAPERQVVAEFSAFLKRHATIQMTSKAGRPYSIARLAGYNAATFDGPRLKAMYVRHTAFLPAHPQVLCVMQRAMWAIQENGLKVENLKLATVCQALGVPLEDAHDALGDVIATAHLARVLGQWKKAAAAAEVKPSGLALPAPPDKPQSGKVEFVEDLSPEAWEACKTADEGRKKLGALEAEIARMQVAAGFSHGTVGPLATGGSRGFSVVPNKEWNQVAKRMRDNGCAILADQLLAIVRSGRVFYDGRFQELVRSEHAAQRARFTDAEVETLGNIIGLSVEEEDAEAYEDD